MRGSGLLASIIAVAAVSVLALSVYGAARQHFIARHAEGTAQALSRAIAMLASESSTDTDGYPLPPAGAVALADGYQLPAGSAAGKTDSFGTLLLYCPWDNGSANLSTGRNTGDAAASAASPLMALVSAGQDKAFQTSCADARAGLRRGDDTLRLMTVAQWRTSGSTKYVIAPLDCENASTPTTDLAGVAVDCAGLVSRLDLLPTSGLADGAIVSIRKSGKFFQWVAAGAQWRAATGPGGAYAAPDAYSFQAVAGAALNSLVVSNTVTLAHNGAGVPISIDSAGQYQLNGGPWVSTLGSANPGDTVAVRLTSPSTSFATTSTTLNVAGQARSFVVSTGSTLALTAYTGNGSSQAVSSGLDLSTRDGIVFMRDRSAAGSFVVYDTARGRAQRLLTSSAAGTAASNALLEFTTSGFTVSNAGSVGENNSGSPTIALSLGSARNFVSIETWSGSGVPGLVPHSLGAVPGLIMAKRLDAAGDWQVYHSSLGATKALLLNTASAALTDAGRWNNAAPTASAFTVGAHADVNAAGGSYIAYLVANATGIARVGSYTGSAADVSIDCGFAGTPRVIWIKRTDVAGNWVMFDQLRGIVNGSNDPALYLNAATAEMGGINFLEPTGTGFIAKAGASDLNVAGGTYSYVALK
jgi:hypothetical protein